MLSKYRSLIYANNEEMKEVENTCLSSVCDRHPDIPRNEIIRQIESDEATDIGYDYYLELAIAEGERLISLVREKIGVKLWTGKAWKQKGCKKTCPYGDVCTKTLLQIDDDRFCFGQLFLMGITDTKKLIPLLNEHHIELIYTESNAVIDVNRTLTEDTEKSRFYKERLGNFFFDYLYCSIWFGEDYGEKIIQLL